jgi:hypothetical protein
LSVAISDLDVGLSSPPISHCMSLRYSLHAITNFRPVALLHHTRTLHTASKPMIRLNSTERVQSQLGHFLQTALLNFITTVLCHLELRKRSGHNTNGRFYAFLEGMRTWEGERDCRSSEGGGACRWHVIRLPFALIPRDNILVHMKIYKFRGKEASFNYCRKYGLRQSLLGFWGPN